MTLEIEILQTEDRFLIDFKGYLGPDHVPVYLGGFREQAFTSQLASVETGAKKDAESWLKHFLEDWTNAFEREAQIPHPPLSVPSASEYEVVDVKLLNGEKVRLTSDKGQWATPAGLYVPEKATEIDGSPILDWVDIKILRSKM